MLLLFAFRLLITNYSCRKMVDKQSSTAHLKIFSLTRLKSDCKVTPVRVDFSSNTPRQTPSISIIPCYNDDHQYFTPAFILPNKKNYYINNAAFQKSQFDEKIVKNTQQCAAINSNNQLTEIIDQAPHTEYCQICLEKFEDYFYHISLKSHKIRTLNSSVNFFIEDAAKQFTFSPKNLNTCESTKQIKKRNKGDCKKITNSKKQKDGQKMGQSLQKGHNHSTALLEQF